MGLLSEYKTVKEIVAVKYPVVFYAENRHYYQYFKNLLEELQKQEGLDICYITSDKNDPVLLSASGRVKAFYIRWWLAFLFSRLRASVMIMTMPDLDNYIFKKSPSVDKYIYIFHAIVSTHQQYTKKAFDNYNTIFCTGQYQAEEIRLAERKNQLLTKELVGYGYPLIDAIKDRYNLYKKQSGKNSLRVLIAPSWYQHCIFDTCLEKLVLQLSKFPYEVYIRPHPEYVKRRKRKFEALKKMVAGRDNLYFDYSMDVVQSLVEADILLTDRSGIALEYALGTHRPVLFIETPPKVINPNWKQLDIEPVENQIRSQIGIAILPEEMESIGHKINELLDIQNDYSLRLQSLEKELLFNSPESYKRGLEYVIQKTKNTG